MSSSRIPMDIRSWLLFKAPWIPLLRVMAAPDNWLCKRQMVFLMNSAKLPSRDSDDAPTWLQRLSCACVTVACDAERTGVRTRQILMHPGDDIDPMLCRKMAADVLIIVLRTVALEAPPHVIAKIEQDLAERLSFVYGLPERDEKDHSQPE